ncbi:MAG: phage tail protein [Leptolyngbyaceae cyanobacterium CSU_1_3]|nr:phage tail protein [Leptolyngbyaceae cyanobacterium CSU_1_3]
MTTFRPSLLVQVTSMRPPQATDTPGLVLYESQIDAATKNLVVYPDEFSEVVVRLENQSDRPLLCSLEVKGNFPTEWCLYSQTQPQEIAPNQALDLSIIFQIPHDFFESQLALHQGRSQLQLDYQSQVLVYVHRSGGSQLEHYEVFTLSVRPSSTYLNFLPVLFQETDFVSRFLAIFEQTFDPAVQTLETLWAYIDPLTAPEAFLPFLAHWVAWKVDSRWDVSLQRRLIRNALTLYRWHGTRKGLRFYLHLYTNLPLDEHLPEAEKHISIEEVSSQGFIMGKTCFGQDSMFGGGQPYHFIVRLRPDPTVPIDEALIHSIIEDYKPAFCSYELQFVN